MKLLGEIAPGLALSSEISGRKQYQIVGED